MREKVFIKICGIMRFEDAELAADLGASALGFIFWPGSPRCVDPERAGRIVRSLPGDVTPVGVFVDQPIELVERVADCAGVTVVQLHGSESAAYCRQMRRPVIKAIGVGGRGTDVIESLAPEIVVLLDAPDPVRHGGTGRTIDWVAAREIAQTRRAILSGGLHADNVASAIEAVRPYGLDVSSGVESTPGVKDAARLKDFFAAVRTSEADVG